MRVVVLGAPRAPSEDCWKDDLAEGCALLGWQVVHLPARGIPVEDVVRACRGADLFIWARTHGHDPKGDAEAMLRRVEDAGTTTVGLHLDLYWTLPGREARVGNQPWWSCQHVFTADGGPDSAKKFAERGVNHHWCPPPIGARWLGRAEPSPMHAANVVFVGGHVPSIHGQHRKQLIDWARRRYGHGFRWVGRAGNTIVGAELSALYSSVRVAVGDSAPAPYYWSDRVPRTLGRGGLLAYPNTEGLDEQGLTAETMLRFDRFDFDHLGEQIDALTEAQRRELTDNALTVVSERHTWPVRLREIEGTVFGCA